MKNKKRTLKIYMIGNNHPIKIREYESVIDKMLVELTEQITTKNYDVGGGFGWFIDNSKISHIKVGGKKCY